MSNQCYKLITPLVASGSVLSAVRMSAYVILRTVEFPQPHSFQALYRKTLRLFALSSDRGAGGSSQRLLIAKFPSNLELWLIFLLFIRIAFAFELELISASVHKHSGGRHIITLPNGWKLIFNELHQQALLEHYNTIIEVDLMQ